MLKFVIVIFLSVITIDTLADFKSGGDAYKSGDYETAAKEFLPLAENGDHRAMYALGSMYAAGHGVPQDYSQAFKWFRSAAQYGRPDAEFKIGLMYKDGLGVEQNYRRAINWFGKAAKKGYGLAQYRIGLMYAEGHGVTQNYVKAYAWLLNALSKEVTQAKDKLDEITKMLSPEQLEEAQTLAMTYQKKFSKH